MTIQAICPKVYRALSLFVSTEQTRFYLQGVYLQNGNDGHSLAIATDGHRMGIAENPHAFTLRAPVIIRASKDMDAACKKLIKQMADYPALAADGEIGLFYNEHTYTLECRMKDGAVTMPHAAIDGAFPDWARVLPKEHGADAPAVNDCYNAEFLATFAQAAQILRGDKKGYGAGIRVVSHEIGAPAWVDTFAHGFAGVVMPMRGDGFGSRDFLRAAPAPADAPAMAAE